MQAHEDIISLGFYTVSLSGVSKHRERGLVDIIYLGPVYTGPGEYGTGLLQDLNGSVFKRSHDSGPKLFDRTG